MKDVRNTFGRLAAGDGVGEGRAEVSRPMPPNQPGMLNSISFPSSFSKAVSPRSTNGARLNKESTPLHQGFFSLPVVSFNGF